MSYIVGSAWFARSKDSIRLDGYVVCARRDLVATSSCRYMADEERRRRTQFDRRCHWSVFYASFVRLSQLFFRQLPELLFYVGELRALVCKYNQVIQRYYVQYLSGYDAIVLNEQIQLLTNVPEDESIILSSICNSIGSLSLESNYHLIVYKLLYFILFSRRIRVRLSCITSRLVSFASIYECRTCIIIIREKSSSRNRTQYGNISFENGRFSRWNATRDVRSIALFVCFHLL